MKTSAHIIRKFRMWMGWRKPQPTKMDKLFVILEEETKKSQKKERARATPESVRYVDTLQNQIF